MRTIASMMPRFPRCADNHSLGHLQTSVFTCLYHGGGRQGRIIYLIGNMRNWIPSSFCYIWSCDDRAGTTFALIWSSGNVCLHDMGLDGILLSVLSSASPPGTSLNKNFWYQPVRAVLAAIACASSSTCLQSLSTYVRTYAHHAVRHLYRSIPLLVLCVFS